jgi:ATP-dependent DNA helicase RecQ
MKERFGAALVAQVLKGSRNKKVLQFGLDRLSTYGIMKEYTEKEIKDMINVLIAEGYLGLTEGQYPIVKLQNKAVPVLKNKEKVLQKIQKKKEKASTDNTLFEILRSLRKDISTREKVPPYIIFSDSSIREMSQRYPQDDGALLAIKGVGEAKLKKYGNEFLEAIKKYIEENGIKGSKTAFDEQEKKSKEDKTPSHVITFNLYQQGKSLEEIALTREMTPITIQNHMIRCASEGLPVDLDDFIPKEYEALIVETIEQVGAEKLKPIKEMLPDEVDYLAIKAVLCKYK